MQKSVEIRKSIQKCINLLSSSFSPKIDFGPLDPRISKNDSCQSLVHNFLLSSPIPYLKRERGDFTFASIVSAWLVHHIPTSLNIPALLCTSSLADCRIRSHPKCSLSSGHPIVQMKDHRRESIFFSLLQNLMMGSIVRMRLLIFSRFFGHFGVLQSSSGIAP